MDNFGSVRKTLQKLKRYLEGMCAAAGRKNPSYEETKTCERIAELHHREELMWRQCVQWLSEGDKTPTSSINVRVEWRKKKITRLLKPNGEFTDNPHELIELARDFCSNLYESEGTSGMD
jgi:hypothetical protein